MRFLFALSPVSEQRNVNKLPIFLSEIKKELNKNKVQKRPKKHGPIRETAFVSLIFVLNPNLTSRETSAKWLHDYRKKLEEGLHKQENFTKKVLYMVEIKTACFGQTRKNNLINSTEEKIKTRRKPWIS